MKKDLLEEYYEGMKVIGGIKHYDYLPLETLEALVKSKEADPKEKQNEAPSIKEMIEFGHRMKEVGCTVLYHGYRVFPPRDDVRVSVEGFRVVVSNDSQELMVTRFGGKADEFDKRSGEIRAWWD